MLKQCLDSVFKSRDSDCSVILVDNNSGIKVIELIKAEFPRIQVIELERNSGFAAGVNRAIETVSEPYVLLLNTDAILTNTALSHMVDALEAAGDDCAGIAPKMMLSVHNGVIDAIGTVMPDDGASFNRGIGQCDVGQYDEAEEVFGTCFGATLLRTELLQPDRIGSLYEGYFLYFEDSDWCMRARSQGFYFLTEPKAVVYHLHSGVTRHETLAFKYKLIELNTLKIVVRTFESPILVTRIVASRIIRLLARTLIRRKYIRGNLSVISSFLRSLPLLISERRQLSRLRTVPDSKIFDFASGEEAYFDTVNYRPQDHLAALISAYERLSKTEDNGDRKEILAILRQLKKASSVNESIFLREKLLDMVSGEPECVLCSIRDYAEMSQPVIKNTRFPGSRPQ